MIYSEEFIQHIKEKSKQEFKNEHNDHTYTSHS